MTWLIGASLRRFHSRRSFLGLLKHPGTSLPRLNERIAAQRSVFTIHPDPTAPLRDDRLQHWTVSQGACRELKLTLDSCTVNYATLFPDLHGLARHVGWRYKWGLSQGQ